MTEPRDGAPDDRERDLLDEEAQELDEPAGEPAPDEIDEGAPLEIDDEDIEDDLVDESEAEVDDYDAAVREVSGAGTVVAPPVAPRGPRGPRLPRRPASAPQRAPSPSEIAVHVREDWSRAFVIVTVVVFLLILLNGVFFGHGGVFTPIPSETPEPTPAPSASESAEPSGLAEPSDSESPEASASASPAAS